VQIQQASAYRGVRRNGTETRVKELRDEQFQFMRVSVKAVVSPPMADYLAERNDGRESCNAYALTVRAVLYLPAKFCVLLFQNDSKQPV